MRASLHTLLAGRRRQAVLGLLVLAWLIWSAGDAIVVQERRPLGSAGARIGLIVLLALLLCAWEALRRLRAWRANRALLEAIGRGSASNAALAQREVAELERRFGDALATLRNARFDGAPGGGRHYLYQLPWYVFIGAPGSGKTTALLNSGLRFPLAGRLGEDAVEGVGGTRHCDWWFTDEAVLIDTAGRYATQDSNREVDGAAWSGFLALLRKFRPVQALNGALVTVSLADLASWSAPQRDDYARAVRARVQELASDLGVRVPIYVLVTKCDLLAGFSEFFGDLGREARAQVWGASFEFPAPAHGSPGAGFADEFDALVGRLLARLTTRMQDEREPSRRATLFAFPQQFAALKASLGHFLDEAFFDSAFVDRPLVRGVYFTSGTQEGSPLDRVLGNIAQAYGLERSVVAPAAASGRSYFLTQLLRGVIFAESDIGGLSAVVERRRERLAWCAHGLLALLALLLLAGWTTSFLRNRALTRAVDAAAAAVQRQTAALPPLPAGDVLAVLPVLDAARAIPGGYAERDAAVPLSRGLGLSQGEKLGSAACAAYLKLLRDVFLPRVAARLEQQIRSVDSPEIRYEALKTYLMLHDPPRLNPGDVEDWVGADWERSLPRVVTRQQRMALAGHLRAALAQVPLEMSLTRDQALVDDVRGQFAASSLAERAYQRLRRLGIEGVPEFRVSDAAGPLAALVFARSSGAPLSQGIPALFTPAGYDKGFRARAPALVRQLGEEETWVLGAGPDRQGATRFASAFAQLRQLYLSGYMKAWDELLADLRPVPADSLQASVQTITLLSAGDSPLRRLLAAVASQTRLASGDERAPEAVVDAHFEPVRRLVDAAAGQAMPLDATLAVLKEYEVQLRAADEAIKRGAAPGTDALILARIRGDADRMPAPVNTLLNGLVSRSSAQAAGAAQAGVMAAAAGELGGLCRQAVEGRYPFDRAATQEVPLADFAKLFGPMGVIDGFVRTRLTGMVDMGGPVWRPAQLAEGIAALPPAAIRNFQRAAAIRDAFFAGAAPAPAASVDLLLRRVDDGVSEAQLIVDGQVTHLVPGTNAGVRLSWPSPSPTHQIQLRVVVDGRPATPALVFDGPWALFRFVDAGRIEGGSADRQSVSFVAADTRVLFELRSPSVRNPLRLPELAQFRCPA